MRRELREELELTVGECTPFLGCTFGVWFQERSTRKIFFSVEVSSGEIQSIMLHEGQGPAGLVAQRRLAVPSPARGYPARSPPRRGTPNSTVSFW